MLAPLLALVLARPVTGPCPVTDGREHVRLGLGTQRVLTVSKLEKYTLSNPEIVQPKTIGSDHLLLISAAEGRTSLVLYEDKGKRELVVDVTRAEACDLVICELCKLFPCGSTLDLRMVGDRIYLDGEASSLEEWKAARLTTVRYPNVAVLGRLKQSVIDAAFSEANRELERLGFPKARLVPAGTEVFLEGTVDDDRREHLTRLAAPLLERLRQHLWRPPGTPGLRPAEDVARPGR